MGRPCLCCKSCIECSCIDSNTYFNKSYYVLILSNYDSYHSGPLYSTWGNDYVLNINSNISMGSNITGLSSLSIASPIPDIFDEPKLSHAIWVYGGDQWQDGTEKLYKYVYHRRLLKCYDILKEEQDIILSDVYGEIFPFGDTKQEKYPLEENIISDRYTIGMQALFTQTFYIELSFNSPSVQLIDPYFKHGVLSLWRLIGNYSPDEWDDWKYENNEETSESIPVSIPQKYQLCLLFSRRIIFDEKKKEDYGKLENNKVPVSFYTFTTIPTGLNSAQTICCTNELIPSILN